VRVKRIPLPEELRRWVADVDLVTASHGEPPNTQVPDTATVLAFRTIGRHSDLLVVGPRTRASYHASKEITDCLRIRIRPGRARPLLGVPVSQLVDRFVPLSELWGEQGAVLVRELAGRDPGAILDRLGAVLLTRVAAQSPGERSRTELVHAATEGLSAAAGPEPERVRVLAHRLGVSERHLRNLFAAAVGVSPKRFARIDRVRQVLAGAEREPWAQLAATAGYFDQSHMTAEFRDLMGVPPGAFVAGHLPLPRPC
jgi:AraC-like DNA-binding protein